MTDMQYDSSRNEFGGQPVLDSGTDITGKIVTWGIAKNRQQAEYVLIGIAALAFIVAYFVYSNS